MGRLLKRWWFWAGIVLVATPLTAYLLFPPRGPSLRIRVMHMRLGMTRQEVYAALGPPSEEQDRNAPVWRNQRYAIKVIFTPKDQVYNWVLETPDTDNWLEKIRDWLDR